MGASFQLHVKLYDGNKTIGTDGSIDWNFYGIFSGALELLNLEMLLEPLEEQLYLAVKSKA